MDEETYDKLRDDALERDREREDDYEKTAWEEAREDIEREAMQHIREIW